jgi:signal transduction histidine kinase
MTFVILCVFAVAVGTLTTRRVRSDFNHQVQAYASTLHDQLQILGFTARGALVTRPELNGHGPGALAPPPLSVIRIVTSDGVVLASRPNKAAPDLGKPFEAPGPFRYEYNGYQVEMRPESLMQGGVIFLQYARPLSDVEVTLNRVRLFLLFGIVGGTALALLAGVLIARRAMAPIAALTATAREIERTRDPGLAIPAQTSDDEVAELARTLEGMLRALSGARAETETMLARQREFVADASHELRTPLTSVLANLELLAESLDGDQGDAARSALRSSRRMRRLVADLLLLARADVGQPAVHKPLDLREVLFDAAAELEPLSRDHDLVLDAEPARMRGAADDLQRLVLNLIENALRHTPPGTQVRAATRTLPDRKVELMVEDDGPGIPADMLPRLFDRFVRGSGDRGGSFGLGLSIVRAVADAHAGTVVASHPPSGGARFTVTFPATAPREARAEASVRAA